MGSNGGHIGTALRVRYPAPEWAVFFEVANGTGSHARRYADAVAMNLYPSRGLELHGFEFKTARSDWQREIKNPAKAEDIFKFCDRWWIVATPDIIKEGELPPTWGHIEFKGGKLRQVVAAPRLEPVPATRAFVAALIRRAGQADEETLRTLVYKETEQLRASEKRRADEEVARRLREQEGLLKKIATIKERSGIDLLDYTPPTEVADAIKLVLASNVLASYSGIKGIRDSAERFVKRIDQSMAAFKPKETTHG